jgi:iron complex transport system substrate-binding protein
MTLSSARVSNGAKRNSVLQRERVLAKCCHTAVQFHDGDAVRRGWVSELIGIAGGDDCFPELAVQSLGKNRIIADSAEITRRNPDIIIGSWCGKKFRPEKVAARPGWENVNAVKYQQLFEIKSADILQPGPAALTDGVSQLHRIVTDWNRSA